MALNINGNIISSTDITSVGVFKTEINRDGLVLYLDAGNLNSYPGSGTVWNDLSGLGNNFTFGANISWNSGGYFVCTGGSFIGPASNSFGFNNSCEHYIEAYIKCSSISTNSFFNWSATPNTGADTRAIFSHLYYSDGNTYYDVAGCCAATQRISYVNDADLAAGVRHISYLTRLNGFPQRQFSKNLISQMNSGTSNLTATVTWNLTSAAFIAAGWLGDIYSIKVYNRPLNPFEQAENFQAEKGRYGL